MAGELKLKIDTQGIERCGVGAQIYDAFILFKSAEVSLDAPKIAVPRGDKIIIDKAEFVKWIKIVNGDVWKMKEFEIILE